MEWLKSIFGKKETSSNNEGIIIELVIRDEKYILEQFDIEFKRNKNRNSYHESEVYGGFITCTFDGYIGKHLLAWAVYGDQREDGDIRFYIRKHSLEQGATLALRFMEANCIYLNRIVNNQKNERKNKLIIAPHILKIGSEEFVNNWRS